MFEIERPLTTSFVNQYKVRYSERKEQKKQNDEISHTIKQVLNKEYEAIISEKNKFINKLKEYRKGKVYNSIVKERNWTIEDLREAFDYPNYKKLDIDAYFKIWELGHLVPIAKPAIKRNIPKLRKLLIELSNEDIDIATRYDRALRDDLKVEGIGKAFISKVLVAHKPDLYFVKNNMSEQTLSKYGIQLPRGLTEGEKYRITCKVLREVRKKADFKSLAVLDFYLYQEARDE